MQITATKFLDQLAKINTQDLAEVKGIGPILVNNFSNFVSSQRYTLLVQKFSELEGQGLKFKIQMPQPSVSTGQKGVIVITGTFDISRDSIKKTLESRGYKVSSQISKNTSILLAGAKPGSKLKKAESLGVKVITDYQQIL